SLRTKLFAAGAFPICRDVMLGRASAAGYRSTKPYRCEYARNLIPPLSPFRSSVSHLSRAPVVATEGGAPGLRFFPCLPRLFQLLPILHRLVGVSQTKTSDGFSKRLARSNVASNHLRIARAAVAARQQFSAHFRVGLQICARQVFDLDRSFMVVELAHQILPAADVRPAEKRIGLDLHGALTLGHAPAVVRG